MKLKGLLSDLSPVGKLFVFMGILLLSMGLLMLAGFASVQWIFGVNVISNQGYLDNFNNPDVIPILKYLQVVSAFALMIIPAVLAGILFYSPYKTYLHLSSVPKTISIVCVALAILCATPMINFFLSANQQMQLPQWMHSFEEIIKQYEQKAAELTDVFLTMNNTSDLMINLLIVALLPAIGEELLFRGVFQSLFSDLFKSKHMPVIFTALLFSAIHMQFYGFVPRFLLGLYFGYLLLWSGSLWLPITAHFVNNGAAVLFAWYSQKNNLPVNPDTLGTEKGEWIWVVLSVLLVTALTLIIKKKETKNKISHWYLQN